MSNTTLLFRIHIPDSTLVIERGRSINTFLRNDFEICFAGDVEVVGSSSDEALMSFRDVPLVGLAIWFVDAIEDIGPNNRVVRFFDFYGTFDVTLTLTSKKQITVSKSPDNNQFVAGAGALCDAIQIWVHRTIEILESSFPVLKNNLELLDITNELTTRMFELKKRFISSLVDGSGDANH